jgi:1-deoxy-D-xylulose-5-phosphate reductoisomerase
MNTRSVLVLGSTGSIGTQALDLIAAHPEAFTVAGLAAGGGDVAALAEQVREHGVRRVAVADPAAAATLRGTGLRGVEVWSGAAAAAELVRETPADIVLNGITGSVGLGPTLAALESGARLALANKESLVAGGPLVTKAAAPGQIVPVDSEHSALAQCLRGGRARRWRAWCSPRPAARSAGGGATTSPASPSSRPWPTRPGPWVRSSRSTPPLW